MTAIRVLGPQMTFKAEDRGRAGERAAYNERLAAAIDQRALDQAMDRVLAEEEREAPAREGGELRAAPAAAAGRWVPIGPSVVRRGQAMDRPRVTGRIRDLAVDATGSRAYAASAMGGVWYTADGASTWAPVGGWAERRRLVGGSSNAQACGCLLVSFGATPNLDVVLVGTGEPAPRETVTGHGKLGGVGVLAAIGPAAGGGAADPWEADSGLAEMEGLGIFRLVRGPAATAGSAAGPTADTVVACTSGGAFLGRRSALPAGGGLPDRNGFTWTRIAALAAAHPGVAVTDAVWLPGGRLVLAVLGTGLVSTDDLGVTLQNIANSQPPVITAVGRMSLARATANRIYLLGEQAGAPTVWVIPDATVATPAVTAVPGLPADLWRAQRDYDQAIAVDVVGGTDRVYVGGSTTMPRPATQWGASLYCYDVSGGGLTPAAGISRTGAPPAGDDADQAGLIGNNVHADVHAVRITGVAPRRQVWVGTDGGVFVSDRAGRVQTFASVSSGISALQPIFVRSHPVSGHMVAAGMQDNGTQVRTGDTVWDELYVGDGGGLAFVPTTPHLLVRQYVQATWLGTVPAAYRDPMTRGAGGPSVSLREDAENVRSAFYSGAAATFVPAAGPIAAHTRLAIGTYRVWITDDLGLGALNTWLTLPFPSGAPADGRPGAGGATTPASLAIGQPAPTLDNVITLAWASPTELLVAYRLGIVRYTEDPPGTWTTKVWRLDDMKVAMPRTTTPTDIVPVPGVRDFYVLTLGVAGGADDTVWFYSPSDDQFHPTGLRHVLDPPPPPVVTGPRDPAYSGALDPDDRNIVFIGTATGVWRGHRTGNLGAHTWRPFVNGLPQAAVQDLHAWVDPAAPGTRLLRAGVQSRGVWEVDLTADARRETWIRAHAFDDRRRPLAAGTDPLATPPAPAATFTGSPDIMVRPRWPRPAAPAFVAAPTITAVAPPPYELWTFQTAFRWLFPSVAATGAWTETLGDLIALHRTAMGKTAVPEIDADVWANVVGSTRVRPDGTVAVDPAVALAVYRAPWHTARSAAAAPTEADFGELVVPPRVGPVWRVYREPSSVDVLLHHRDGREVPAGGAYAVLLRRDGGTPAALMGLPPADVVTYLMSVSAGAPGPVPAGWTAVRQPLTVPLEGRMPRGVTVDVDLSGVAVGRHVLFLAFVGSNADDLPLPDPTMSTVATVPPVTITELVQCWPHTAARVVEVRDRPV